MVERNLRETVQEFYKRGVIDENFVMEATANALGGECSKATKEEDMYMHVDFWWESPKKGRIGIDVKGMKKAKRSDKEFDDTIQWLELKNVRGNKGWLYGDAEYIAFRTKKRILFVLRDKLRDFAEKCVEGKELVHNCPKDFYIPYQRWGRLDMVIKVPTTDIESLADFSINCDQ